MKSFTNYQQTISSAFVLGILAILVVSNLVLIAIRTQNIPVGEDFPHLVPYFTEEKITFAYLWEQETEHRYPLPKLILLALIKLARDCRAPAVFSTFVWAGLAFALIRIARKLWGQITVADAFIPLLFFQDCFSSSYEANYSWVFVYNLPAMVVTICLVIIAQNGLRLTLGSGMLAGICLVLLPLCSAAGLLFLPPLVLWLGAAAILAWRSGERQGKRNALVMLGWILAACILVLLYFWRYDRQASESYVARSSRLWTIFKTSAKVFSSAFGPAAASSSWPYSAIVAVILLMVSTGALLVIIVRPRHTHDRSRGLGLLLFLGSACMIVLGLGWGRAGAEGDLSYNYRQLPVPVFACAYFIWKVFRPRLIASFAQVGFFICIALATAVNIPKCVEYWTVGNDNRIALIEDLRGGMLPYQLIVKYDGTLLFGRGPEYNWLVPNMMKLKRCRFGVFQYLRDDPPFRKLPVPLVPVEVNGVDWQIHGTSGKKKEALVHFTNSEAYVTLALPEPTNVACIYFRYETDANPPMRSMPRLSWKQSDKDQFPEDPICQLCYPNFDLVVAVDQTIDRVRIYGGDPPCDFRLTQLLLWVPETGDRVGKNQPFKERIPGQLP